MNYYNENDPKATAWLRELISAGLIAHGDVDERSIVDVRPDDLAGYAQCHFFAGIGGWSYALRLAGWPDDRPVWTGSCPCQPFSVAGRGVGTDDARHLWPEFARLVGERKPPVVFGEQVAGRAGRSWLSAVRSGLEEMGYAVGAADLCAAGVGAPHIRQRLYWVANGADTERGSLGVDREDGRNRENGGREKAHGQPRARSQVCGLGNPLGQRTEDHGPDQAARTSSSLQVEHRQWERLWVDPWQPSDFVHCLDGYIRPVEPGTCPVADGIPARVGRLRGYGNAIVPEVAAEFIRAFVEAVA